MEAKATECRLCKYNPEYDNVSFIITDDTFIGLVKTLEKNKECNTSMIKEYNLKNYLFVPLKKIKSMTVVDKEYKTKDEIKNFFLDKEPNIDYEFDLDLYLSRYSVNDKKGYTFRIRSMSGTFAAK